MRNMKGVSRAALAIAVASIVSDAAYAASAAPDENWSPWLATSDPNIQYRYAIHGTYSGEFELKNLYARDLTVDYIYNCAHSATGWPPKGRMALRASGGIEIHPISFTSCTSQKPDSVQVSVVSP